MSDGPLILVVDDEDRNRRLLEALLIPEGYSVKLAKDGYEGVEFSVKYSPAVILMDVMMPGISGFVATKQIKENPQTGIIPVVMVTSLDDVSDRVQALESGADDFLTKPVDRTELLARVRTLVKLKDYSEQLIHYHQELEREVERKTAQLSKALEKLRSSSLQTIFRLSRTAEFKDEDTGAHIQRMSHYSAAIALEMGLSDTVAEHILYAAPLHDIGKIGIPDRILLKPGKLDPDEWEIMKRHTTIGARILEGDPSGILRLGEVIALNHHERWDGKGYPRGLAGRKIPLAARIVSIADVFDALLSPRPYKEAFSVDKTLEIMAGMRGTNFDPDVSDAFMRILDKIMHIKDTFLDEECHGLYCFEGDSMA
ncbi:HD domain-containing phosphohydrolase [Pseudodesulfovibrio piezophilus]|uniref:Response regulator rpfG n=1 Tax=Pseudodesulfovibrio piezophilus (strain DSM 21447 / JCM 15486 / C1TLV30) TaxID=1322246 RepID=M1WQE3_PSEP2|nr:HD domain-containing phosphohydrolase [Pseudodesulfovibrio piezophilus]CCH48894.1 Response regulator rpfG [Pseudodesulfovibrio piezophilus C1TLV30]